MPIRAILSKRRIRRGGHDRFIGDEMKKPKLELEEPQRKAVVRADKAPTEGYSLVVDGHFKSHHDTVEAAEEAGLALKHRYQMLQVQVYDAATKTRSMIQLPTG
jgi:hypothetical protein